MLTEEIVKQFEKEDEDLEKALGFWWSVYRRLRAEKSQLHDTFRAAHELTGSNLHSIADWRWKQKH